MVKTNEIKVSNALFKTISEDTSITGYLNVGGNVNLNKTLTITTPEQGGGSIRIVSINNGGESSIGYYNRSDLRNNIAGDMWISGINCWARSGYSIGTSGMDVCLNISEVGNVTAPYKNNIT